MMCIPVVEKMYHTGKIDFQVVTQWGTVSLHQTSFDNLNLNIIMDTSGFCKTSYHLLISPPPTNLPNTLKIHTGENKIDR